MKKHAPVPDTNSEGNANISKKQLHKPIGPGNVSYTKHTWVFFDDDFSMIAHVGQTGFSVLPQWLDRVEDYLEFKVIDKHGNKIKA
jgi:hypothetical protein